jgi:hypothetical protein
MALRVPVDLHVWRGAIHGFEVYKPDGELAQMYYHVCAEAVSPAISGFLTVSLRLRSKRLFARNTRRMTRRQQGHCCSLGSSGTTRGNFCLNESSKLR